MSSRGERVQGAGERKRRERGRLAPAVLDAGQALLLRLVELTSGNTGSRSISTASRIAGTRLASVVPMVAEARPAPPVTVMRAFSFSISSCRAWRVRVKVPRPRRYP